MTPMNILLGVGAATLIVAGTATFAQAYYGDEDTTVGGVTVYAPRTVGRSSIGAPIQVVTEQVVIPTGDLDLGTGWGMHALRERVRQAAYNACQDLEDRYPVSADNDGDCYGTTVRRAYDQVAYRTGYQP